MSFIPGLIPAAGENGPSWWFLFRGNELLIQREKGLSGIPCVPDPETLGVSPTRMQYLGKRDGVDCFSGECPPDAEPLDGMEFLGLRQLFGVLGEEDFQIAGRAIQIVKWDQRNQYCGRCGSPTFPASEERARICPECGLRHFPRLSPAVIVAVLREDRILLARADRFPKGLYSVLAGFVEPGETLEQCLHREVREETGIEISGIRYFGSQPWPFPDSLMIGFTAQYAGGEIRIDEKEIVEAGWFSADRLPLIPDRISIARRLIDWFVENHR
ncbi:MAG: NAD(+) diphosphatase [Deltaproteobacteria bacterium]|nr:NAD(+) diphosphatase [Deltaproteobacteria bacterium]